MTKKYLIVSATREQAASNTNIFKSLCDISKMQESVSYFEEYHENNTLGLPAVYNKLLDYKTLNKWDCIIFVHDDVYIDDTKVFTKLKKLFEQGYSVIGLAGASKATIKKPALWHLMSDRANQSGCVSHPYGDTMNYATTFGPTPKRCLIMDGLFLAIDCNKFKNNIVKFDEQFTFHHYDLDFCLQCNNAKHKLTTCDIHVIHNSPGLLNPNSPIYTDSEEKFIKKYATN